MTTAWSSQRRSRWVREDYDAAELGRLAQATETSVMDALSIAKRGRIYDLDSGRWPGMPVVPAHPPFQVSTYRTARGMRIQGDFPEYRDNAAGVGYTTEIVSGTVHTGTHLDALCHTTCGEESSWFGGYTSAEHLGDFGPVTAEASSIAPIVSRGVLVDMTRLTGGEPLPGKYSVSLSEFTQVLSDTATEIREGDAVLVNTGYLSLWATDQQAAGRHFGSGIGLEVGEYLADAGVSLVGADNETVEVVPSSSPDNPHPVHTRLMTECGVHLLELVHLADLARDAVYEFAFMCLPLRIRGATGSMVRPIAIV